LKLAALRSHVITLETKLHTPPPKKMKHLQIHQKKTVLRIEVHITLEFHKVTIKKTPKNTLLHALKKKLHQKTIKHLHYFFKKSKIIKIIELHQKDETHTSKNRESEKLECATFTKLH
jgi:hypothetical protein